MDRGVRKIFYALIGTVVLLVLLSGFTELINISLYGIQLQELTNMACEKSLTLFTQESYKQRTEESSLLGGSVNMDDVAAADGSTYVSGVFYDGTTVEEIYRSLYDKSYKPDFSNWVSERKSDGNWQSINLVDQYLNGSFPITTMPEVDTYLNSYSDPVVAYEAYEADVAEYTLYTMAKNYVDAYVTPLNFGVPYMDEDTVNRMFQWNLTQLISNCNSDLIRPDENGVNCIEINGFRIYANQARVINIEYTVYDVTDASERREFMDLTHIDPDNLGFVDDILYLGTNDDERQRICVIGVEYSVPITYIGITPIKNIFNFIWNTEVEGWEGKSDRGGAAPQQYSYQVLDMTGGGYEGNTTVGVLPVPGQLIYYVVR